MTVARIEHRRVDTLRRFNLRRALGTVDASICTAGNSWQMGVCRYQDNDLEWFRLLSLSVRAKHKFKRSSLELLGRDRSLRRLRAGAEHAAAAAAAEA